VVTQGVFRGYRCFGGITKFRTLASTLAFYLEDRGTRFIQNDGKHLAEGRVSFPSRSFANIDSMVVDFEEVLIDS
jgi:hypothetical protein